MSKITKLEACETCKRGAGLPLGAGFSRRRFLKIAGTGLVASYFADVVSPRLLYGATAAPKGTVSLRNTAKGAIFILLTGAPRSEEHTSELQSHSFISYAVFCL